MNRYRWHVALWLGALLAAAPSARAQIGPRDPHIGYIYPAGGQKGDDFEVAVGGQFLDGASDVVFSGEGVEVTVVEHTKPLTQKEINQLRNKLQEAREQLQAKNKKEKRRGNYRDFLKIAEEMGVSAAEVQALSELRKKLNDPKRQVNPQLAETVTLHVKLAPDARPGKRELRLMTAAGLSNPLSFQVGKLPECCETEPNDTAADTGIPERLPVVINGQILPGDVDRFSFAAEKGARLVVAASARELIPYLADAVPGWFQATLVLYDAEGGEVAYADDYQFHPDPVLFHEVSESGRYVLEIKDAVYRGREDFVYRITLGEVPFVTSVFPLGGRDGDRTAVELTGWNLPVSRLLLDAEEKGPGILPISVRRKQATLNRVPFAIDSLPEALEAEPNDGPESATRVEVSRIVNGRIDRPGDWDVFRFDARAGDEIVAEVEARRLNSPLDSVLELTDAQGRQLAVNDDHEDKGEGLTTHHADSRLNVTIPMDGAYYLRLGDTQGKGGTAYGYRLRISPHQADFELRVVPSSINMRAGTTKLITVYALRRDGFSGDVALRLKDAPPGFALSGGWVPGDQDQVRLTLTVPPFPREGLFRLQLEGLAEIEGREIRRPAVPAEDMMQAFIYHHLVPANELMVAVTGAGRSRGALKLMDEDPVELPVGGTARVRLSVPNGPRASNRSFLGQIRLALNDPPDGIAIEEDTPIRSETVIALTTDAEAVQPGRKGNLIVDVFMERTASSRGGKPQAAKRRIPLGTLPAIPFEVVGP